MYGHSQHAYALSIMRKSGVAMAVAGVLAEPSMVMRTAEAVRVRSLRTCIRSTADNPTDWLRQPYPPIERITHEEMLSHYRWQGCGVVIRGRSMGRSTSIDV